MVINLFLVNEIELDNVDMKEIEISPVKLKSNKRRRAIISSDEDTESDKEKEDKSNESRKMVKRCNKKIDIDDDFVVSDSEDVDVKLFYF